MGKSTKNSKKAAKKRVVSKKKPVLIKKKSVSYTKKPFARNKKQLEKSLASLLCMKPVALIEYLQEIGVLKKMEKCENCDHKVLLKESNNTEDGARYKCSRCKRGFSSKKGSIFADVKITLKQAAGLLHCFVCDMPLGVARTAIGTSHQTKPKFPRHTR